MTKFHKIILWIGVIVVLISGVQLFSQYQKITAEAFEEKKISTISYIQSRAADLIKESDFNMQDAVVQQKTFESFFDTIQSSEIFRIKVFNRDPKIIWSNLKEIIGDDASENQDVQDALGQGVSIMKFKSQKPEQVSERQFTEFTETYVPIQNKQGQYIGVIEVYQSNAPVKERIGALFSKSLIFILLFAVISFVVVIFFLRIFIPRSKQGSEENFQ